MEATYFSRLSSYGLNLLDLFLTTLPELYQTFISAPISRSYHVLITISYPLELKPTEISPPGPIWHYGYVKWHGIGALFCFSME